MRFLTDDGEFGFLLSPLSGREMFRFQMIIGGRLIGDSEPCMVGTAMKQLASRPELEDERLSQLSIDPGSVLSVLRTDERLHDSTTMSLAESLDHWVINGYVFGGRFVMLAQEYKEGTPDASARISIVDVAEYDALVGALRNYWLRIGDTVG